MMWMHKTI